jgi:hypothetical protein
VKIARSGLECRLFIELHPCECGGAIDDITHRLVMRSEALCARYEGRCSACGASLEYLFALDGEVAAADKFGGAKVSTIVDAAQFLAASERAAKQVPIHNPTAEARQRARLFINRAISCIEEVLKWIPAGEDPVPRSGFFTEEGERAYLDEPGRFRRARLSAVLTAYREMLLRLGP